MTNAHVAAVTALLAVDATLRWHEAVVPAGAATPYVKLDFYVQRPDGLISPDKISLSAASTVIEVWVYAHCVGVNPTSARAVSGRVAAALLDARPAVAGRECSPIHWRDGQPPTTDESTGSPVIDQVDVYTFTSVPG